MQIEVATKCHLKHVLAANKPYLCRPEDTAKSLVSGEALGNEREPVKHNVAGSTSSELRFARQNRRLNLLLTLVPDPAPQVIPYWQAEDSELDSASDLDQPSAASAVLQSSGSSLPNLQVKKTKLEVSLHPKVCRVGSIGLQQMRPITDAGALPGG